MLNVVSNVPFDRICYYILDIRNFVGLDDTTCASKDAKTSLSRVQVQVSFFLLLISKNFYNYMDTNCIEIYSFDSNDCKCGFENPFCQRINKQTNEFGFVN